MFPTRMSVLNSASLVWMIALIVLGIGLLPGGVLSADIPASTTNAPIIIIAGPDWIPLRPQLDIERGSALDLSGIAGTDSPAGKHGRVVAGPDGQFAFADSP